MSCSLFTVGYKVKGLVWLTVMVCLQAALWAQFSVNVGYGWRCGNIGSCQSAITSKIGHV